MLPFKLVFHPDFNVNMGAHVFPAQKYRLLRERLLHERLASQEDFVAPEPADDADVLRVHTPEYVRKVKSGDFTPVELRTLEVPWSRALVRAVWLAAGGALLAGRLARRDGCAFLLGGGFHHAFPDHGEGFCLVHDVAVAARGLRARGEARRITIVDLDVHHANGTGAIFAGDPDTFTVSLHQESYYPADRPANSIDIGLRERTGDAAYLAALDDPLRAALEFRPDVLFYLAGADPYERDRLGSLKLTLDGLAERDRRVFRAAHDASVPVAVALAGGYAERPADTVTIHYQTVAAAAEVFAA
ncbi:MAG TPA: histone deacetylase [Vicinamibacteria bacterium]|nr:histone deacetylase [Vicinamibacteria bacterium]